MEGPMPLPAALDVPARIADLSGLCLSPREAAPEAALSCDGSSLDSSGTELDMQQQQQQQQQVAAHEQQAAAEEQQASAAGASLPPEQRTHHLLKHCLSQSQRGAALQHFNTSDAREAAKEIARMGQRELQAKFKEVYGSATKSNNNSWLRRKLYEAVGVAPLKANTKGKARKSAAASQRKSGGSKSRSPKAAALKVKREPALGAGLPYGTPALPGGGMSVLDPHHSSGLLSADTSDSEDGSASHGYPGSLHHSAPGTPRSHLGLPFNVAACFGGGGMHQALPPPPGFVPVAEPSSPMACGLHWADGGFSAAQQPPASFLGGGGGSAGMPTLDGEGLAAAAGLPPSTFKSSLGMELEQDAAALWAGDCPSQWYFGSLELGGAGAAHGGPLPSMPPMEALTMGCCDAGAGSACACGEEEEDVPLLTLDLGAIDVSI